MSRPQTAVRPGTAKRPGATTTDTGTQSRKGGPSPEELAKLRALSTSEDTGVSADLDPDNAAAGRIQNEKVTIVDAKYVHVDFKRKDGTYPENAVPKVHMYVFFKREGDEDGDKPYREQYEIGSASVFVPSVDGYKLNVRKSVLREGASIPVPRKQASGTRFLASIKAAGGKAVIDRVNGKEGLAALKGLVIQVSRRKTADMHEKAFPVILVDTIEGVQAPAAPAAGTAAAPQAQAAAGTNTDIQNLAEQLIADVLKVTGGTVERSQIPTVVIQKAELAQWRGHAQRGAILKEIRDDAFVNSEDRNGILWNVEGTALKSL